MYSVLSVAVAFMGTQRGLLTLFYCSGCDVRALQRSLRERYSDVVYAHDFACAHRFLLYSAYTGVLCSSLY